MIYINNQKGEKHMEQKRDIKKLIRFTEEEWETISKAAKKAERKDADYMRRAILKYIEFTKEEK